MSTQRRSAEYDAKKASDASSVISSDEEQAIIKIQIQEESGHQIKYRSCSWQKVSRLITPRFHSLSSRSSLVWAARRSGGDCGGCLCMVSQLLTLRENPATRLPPCYFRSISAWPSSRESGSPRLCFTALKKLTFPASDKSPPPPRAYLLQCGTSRNTAFPGLSPSLDLCPALS